MPATVTKTKPSAYDYATLPSEARIVVKQKTREIHDRIKTTSETLVEIGSRLIEVKEHLPHGEFLPWLDAEFEWDDRTARRFMQVADYVKELKLDTVSNLKISHNALYLLASTSTPPEVKKRFSRKLAAGKPVTTEEVRRAVAEIKEEDIPVDSEPAIEEKPIASNTPKAAPPALDKLGEPIADLEIISIFNRAKELENIARQTSDIKCEIERGIKSGDELFCRMGQQFQVEIESVYHRLKAAMPYCVCRYCKGRSRVTKNCMRCKGTGWQTKEEYGMVEKALKAGGHK